MFRRRPAPAPCLPGAAEEAARCGRADGARARPPAARPHPRPGERRELLQDPAQLSVLQRHRSVDQQLLHPHRIILITRL